MPLPPPIQHRRIIMMDMTTKHPYNAYTESVASYFRALKNQKFYNHEQTQSLLRHHSAQSQELDLVHNKCIEDVADGISWLERKLKRTVGEEAVLQFIQKK